MNELPTLTGLRVLDLSSLLPGPFATQILADLGAEVIKVEPPTGDTARTVPGELFEVVNRNKRSVTFDLKRAEDRTRCLELASDADVLVEGFRPGVADRLGIGVEAVRTRNPRLIYCSITGYGQTGPRRDEAGHDLTFLASAGALGIPGHWGEPPRRSGVPLSDLAASSYAVMAILLALRERERTGIGTFLDVAIRDAALAFTSSRAGSALDRPLGDESHLYPANDLFTSADGRVTAIGALEDHFVDRLRAALGDVAPPLTQERFDDAAGKRRHADELHELVVQAVALLPQPELMERLRRADVPAEPVVSVSDAADQAADRGIVQTVGDQRHVTFPVLSDGRALGSIRSTAPRRSVTTIEWTPRD